MGGCGVTAGTHTRWRGESASCAHMLTADPEGCGLDCDLVLTGRPVCGMHNAAGGPPCVILLQLCGVVLVVHTLELHNDEQTKTVCPRNVP